MAIIISLCISIMGIIMVPYMVTCWSVALAETLGGGDRPPTFMIGGPAPPLFEMKIHFTLSML
jgi:hypothetical protein